MELSDRVIVRKLDHPIAVFVITVLTVIGLGVGVVATDQASKVYGPPGARFTVAFPGRVSKQYIRLPADNGVGYSSSGPYKGRPPNESSVSDGASAQYISTGVSTQGLRALVREFRDGIGLPFERHLTETTEQVNGFVFTRLGPLCVQTLCLEQLIVVHHRALWILSSTATGTYRATWRNFFDSFQPIG